MNRQTFEQELTRQYRALFSTPDYAYSAKTTTPEALAVKMTAGLLSGSASKDGKGIKDTCKLLGIKHTYTAIRSYLKEEQSSAMRLILEIPVHVAGKKSVKDLTQDDLLALIAKSADHIKEGDLAQVDVAYVYDEHDQHVHVLKSHDADLGLMSKDAFIGKHLFKKTDTYHHSPTAKTA